MIQTPIQDEKSNNPQLLLEQFKCIKSGHGSQRIQCATHNTKRALELSTEQLIAVCKHFFFLLDLIMFCIVNFKMTELKENL